MERLLSQMRIPGAHLNRLVPGELLNHFQVLAAHGQPRAERMPVVVPPIVNYLGIFHRRLEPVLRILDRENKSVWARGR